MKLGLSKTDYPFDYFFDKACLECWTSAVGHDDNQAGHNDDLELDSGDSEDENVTGRD